MGLTKTQVLQKLGKLPNSVQEADLILKDVIHSVCSGELSLHEVVEGLSSSLTHTSPAERSAGTRLLADLLHSLPSSSLNTAQITFLVSFFVDRLKDHHSVIPNVFYACLALVKQEVIDGEDVRKLIQGIFREVQCQSHIMSDRRNIYTFFKYCILNKHQDLEALGTDFILGLVTAVDGERDPRNLVLVFSLVPVIVQSIPTGPFTEDLFEVVAAYFPIDFVPPVNDPYGISQEDLVLGLRRALASTPLFAPYCLPLLQEKLDSDINSAKLDALHTLVSCCEIYSGEDIRPHVIPLWHSIRREVVDGIGEGMEQAALSALTAVVTTLNKGPISPAVLQATQSLVQMSLNECVPHLTTPEQRLVFPSARLLLALVVAAQGPATTVSAAVVPLLAEQSRTKKEETAQRNTIIILGKFLGAAAAFPDLLTGGLGQHEEVWWTALSLALSQPVPQVKEAAVVALTAALPALSHHRLSAAATTLTSALLDSQRQEKLKSCIVSCLAALGRLHPSAIVDHVLPHLLVEMERDVCDNDQWVKEVQVLDTLAVLTLAHSQVSQVLPLLWDRTKASLAKKPGEIERAIHYLSCVRKILVNTLEEPECREYIVNEWCGIKQTMALAVSAIWECQDTAKLPSVMAELSAICRLLLATVSEPHGLVESLVSVAIGGSVVQSSGVLSEVLATHPKASTLLFTGLIGNEDSPRAQYMVYMAEGVLMGARSLPESAAGILSQLRKVVWGPELEEKSEGAREGKQEVRRVAAILHASVINKLPKGVSLTRSLEETWSDVMRELEVGVSKGKRRWALTIATWTCKALILRGAEEWKQWCARMQELLNDALIGMEAAHNFGTIVKDHDYALTSHTHANIRLLHKQRFFESVVGPLVELFSTTNDIKTKSCALVAIASLLPWLPHIVLNAHIQKLLPVLLQGLNTSDFSKIGEASINMERNDARCGSETRLSTLTTLASLLMQNASPAERHTSTLISFLMPLTTYHPLTVRVKALECLAALVTLPVSVILPYRNEVVRGLRSALDDRKRVVRQAATHTRSLWILVGAPGGF
ncbi:hypothetical protein Pcinc_018392 [Petrolisthes cinctipes]|uniref:MMS19 nucleotide excision repair protein n=1 Tax=Petrolisthes cinctipes TaxID=88211 RepID=A0AAE1FS61_PETCI|nr:hypothetical protein Pcinc_018392 [Petrolisthes cinctipes]